MPTRYEPGEKFPRVIRLFQRLCDTRVGLTSRQIADELEVDLRSAQRYLKVLREQAGIDIEQADGRYRVGAGSRLPAMQLDYHQAVALLEALRLMHQMRAEQDPALVGALAQLARVLKIDVVTRYLEATLESAEHRPVNAERRQIERVVVDGFVKHQPVEVQYTDARGASSKRVLRPYFLEPRPEGRAVYVFALDEKSEQVRPFRLDRIGAARMLNERFTVPESFDINALVAGSWGIWQADGQDEVVLRFSVGAARRVRETLWHAGAQFGDVAGGGLEMRLRVASEVEMRPWVLGWGALVEVMEPPSLREFVAVSMRRGSEMYRAGDR